MISTVTTTVSTVVSTVANTQVLASLGLAAVLTLIASLIMKELVSANNGVRLSLFGRRLDVVILPLLFVFSFILINKVIQILFF